MDLKEQGNLKRKRMLEEALLLSPAQRLARILNLQNETMSLLQHSGNLDRFIARNYKKRATAL